MDNKPHNDALISGNGSVVRQFLRIFLFLMIFIGLIIFYLYQTEFMNEKKILSIKETKDVELQRNIISSDFKTIVSDLLYISEQNALNDMIEKGGEREYERLSRVWRVFSSRKKLYDQIRYIDENGMEIVRINYNNGEPIIVPKDRLQDKSKRYFFVDTMKLREGEVFVSPFDLNIEQDKIELPYKPMIRFSTPVYDSRNNIRGIVILNYYGEQLIMKLVRLSEGFEGRAMLLNSEGYWLHAPDPKDEWGFMFGNRRTFGISFPAVWEKISKNESGQVYGDYGLFTFTTAYPLLDVQNSGVSSSKSSGQDSGQTAWRGYYWKVVSHIPPSVIAAMQLKMLKKYVLLFLVLTLLIGVGSWTSAKSTVRRNQMELRLLELSEIDSLTGVYNRRKLFEFMEAELDKAARYARPLSILMFDIDHFKQVNDTYGHAVGDYVLKRIVEIVNGCIRKVDIIARYGGEEFIVISPETEFNGIRALGEKIRISVKENKFDDVGEVTISVGATQYGAGDSSSTITKRVDDALYKAKNGGRNRVEFL